MKKWYIFTINGLFIVGQSVFSYQNIIQKNTIHQKLHQVQIEKTYGKVHAHLSDSSVEYVTYKYKKKEKNFRPIENKVALIKKTHSLPSTGNYRQSELSKIAKVLSGRLLIGSTLWQEQ